jgi:capsular exopolysaccharide synthesis family protein
MSKFNEQEYYSLYKVFFLISKNWFWFLISLSFFFFLSFLINRYSKEIRSNNITLHINSSESMSNPISQALGQANGSFSNTNFTDEILFISSYPIIYKTIEELGVNVEYYIQGKIKTIETYNWKPIAFYSEDAKKLYGLNVTVKVIDKNEFVLSSNFSDNEIYKFGENIKFGEGSFEILLNKEFKIPEEDYPTTIVKVLNPHLATRKYKQKLSVDRLFKDASMLNVSVSGEDIFKETAFLNKLSEIFIRENLMLKNQASKNTIQFISQQLSEMKDSLSYIESKLLIFKKNNISSNINLDSEPYYKEISVYQNQKSKLLIERKYYEYLKNYLNQNMSYNDLVIPSFYGIDKESLNSLTTKLVEAQLERNSVDPNLNSINPLKLNLSEKIDQLKKSIYETLESQNSINDLLLEDIDSRISFSESLLNNLPSLERELINIEREHKLIESMYVFLMEKQSEAEIIGAANVSDVRVLEPALVQSSRPVSPNTQRNYLISLLFGLFSPFLVITLFELFNNNVVSKNDITSLTSIPFIGLIGKKFSGYDLVVYEKPKSTMAETFRNVRSNIEFLIKKSDIGKTILITSSVSGEGKTFCAKNFASLYSMAGKKTIIIGADLRKPKMYLSFQHENKLGLSNYLNGDNQLDEIISSTIIDGLHFIPSGPIPPNPAEMLESEGMLNLIEKLKLKYDYIIIDTPPICLVSDALILMDKVDLNIYVVRQNFTKKDFLSYVNDLYSNKKVKNLSILINDADFSIGYGYSYGYGRYNYGKYGSGYYEEN